MFGLNNTFANAWRKGHSNSCAQGWQELSNGKHITIDHKTQSSSEMVCGKVIEDHEDLFILCCVGSYQHLGLADPLDSGTHLLSGSFSRAHFYYSCTIWIFWTKRIYFKICGKYIGMFDS